MNSKEAAGLTRTENMTVPLRCSGAVSLQPGVKPRGAGWSRPDRDTANLETAAG